MYKQDLGLNNHQGLICQSTKKKKKKKKKRKKREREKEKEKTQPNKKPNTHFRVGCRIFSLMRKIKNKDIVYTIFQAIMIRFGLVYLFNGISTPYVLFNGEILVICKWSYVFIQLLRHGKDATPGQFLSEVRLVWIQSFPSLRHVTWPRLSLPWIILI